MTSSSETTGAVVVVTDDPRLAPEITYGFPSSMNVHVVSDAREALRIMRDVVPSVVVVDIQTGSAGGYGLQRDMLSDARLESVPLLMLLERSQDAWLATQAGATRYLVKPVEVGELVYEALSLVPNALA